MRIKKGIFKHDFNVGDTVICSRFVGGPRFVDNMERFVGKEGVIKTVDPEKKWVTVHGWYWPMSAVKKVR